MNAYTKLIIWGELTKKLITNGYKPPNNRTKGFTYSFFGFILMFY